MTEVVYDTAQFKGIKVSRIDPEVILKASMKKARRATKTKNKNKLDTLSTVCVFKSGSIIVTGIRTGAEYKTAASAVLGAMRIMPANTFFDESELPKKVSNKRSRDMFDSLAVALGML